MRKLLYAITVVGLAGATLFAQGVFDPTRDFSVGGLWTFAQTPTLSALGGTIVTTSATQTLTAKTLTAPTLTAITVTGTSTIANGMTLTTPIINNPTLTGPAAINITTTPVTLGPTHVGRIITLNKGDGLAIVLPAATGTGNHYLLHVGTVVASASTIKVNTTPGTDVMQGTALLFQDAADTVVGFATGATSDTIDLLGTANSTGGMVGATIDLIDSATGIWSVRYVSDAGGTEATPFSATVP